MGGKGVAVEGGGRGGRIEMGVKVSDRFGWGIEKVLIRMSNEI